MDESCHTNFPGMVGVNSTKGVLVHWLAESTLITAFVKLRLMTEVGGITPLGKGEASLRMSVSFLEHETKRMAVKIAIQIRLLFIVVPIRK
jgi:hypothetical protein